LTYNDDIVKFGNSGNILWKTKVFASESQRPSGTGKYLMNIETNNNLIFILLLNVEVGREYIGALKSDGTSDFMQYLDDTPMVFADDNDWESF